MKVFEVEIVGRETIKPSSPTPANLRRYSLSMLDQIAPPVFMPLIVFFPKDDLMTNEEKIDRLKRSLSQALARFYPLAGRVKGDNLSIECNDEGAHYVEARVECDLADILENPVPGLLNRLLPFKLEDVGELVAAFQVSLFNCGGLALSFCISHKAADALSFFTFINSWAAIARGDIRNLVTPCFDSAAMFPAVDPSLLPRTMGIVPRRGSCLMRPPSPPYARSTTQALP
ncbi:hypothetical protein SAY87_013100 [Trapa incisa]|uniref:Uncharacterized protein n=1 Tax=Trapa incisa TaxID=236973 RepID=A0AAN7KCK0_9MYRT|nr:hypothetical protein SAY87_013100 [Trapa incisa]